MLETVINTHMYSDCNPCYCNMGAHGQEQPGDSQFSCQCNGCYIMGRYHNCCGCCGIYAGIYYPTQTE